MFIRLWITPTVDVFTMYDEQQGSSADDPSLVWILRRDKLHLRPGLVRLWRIILPKPTLRNLKWKDRLLTSKIHYFHPILANYRVDITILILYLGLV